MRHFRNIEVGAATHTGLVRSANEDDYLIYVPQDRERLRERGCLFVVADGMGGASGGAEASRAAVRALAGSFVGNGDAPEAGSGDEDQSMASRMREGFAAANRQVLELAKESPSLRDMGTTLTAANLSGSRLVLGHVGDTRCLLLRNGQLAQLTHDHAVRSPDNYLTRCVGAGQEAVEADVANHRLQVGDRILLVSDGLWSMVGEAELTRIARTAKPQIAAEELVRRANLNGGPDNSTVLIVHVRSVAGQPGEMQSVDLPSDEVRQPSNLQAPVGTLLAPRWPWLVMASSVLLVGVAAAKIVFDVDLPDLLMRYFGRP
jgi:serine/threonine protein phosphatase PrpC